MEKNKFVFIFTSYHLLPLATGKDYPNISKIGQQNPGITLKDFISAYFNCDFHTKIYQNTNFHLTSSFESADIPAEVLLRSLLHKYKNSKYQQYLILKFLWLLLITHIEEQHETYPKCR